MSKQQLIEAIIADDLNAVQRIVAVRDTQGIPVVGLNDGFYNYGTALFFALSYKKPINSHIVQVLLNIRDNNHNPVININHRGPHGRTVFSAILDNDIPAAQRAHLLQSMLDLRGAHGELIADLSADHCNQPLLSQALERNDIHCLRMLLDVRNRDGTYALDVNEVRFGKTLLDEALRRDNSWYRYDQAMVDAITAAGGVTAVNVHQNRPVVAVQPIIPQAQMLVAPIGGVPIVQPTVVEVNAEAQAFIQDNQNTHNPKVTTSVNASILKLRKRYKNIDFASAVQAVRTCLENSQRIASNKKVTIKVCLDRIERDPTSRSGNNATLSEALALVWHGVHDKTALTEDMVALTDQDIVLREESLLNTLHKAQTEYTNPPRPACFVGTFNQIVQMLDRVHPDVTVISGNVISAATVRAQTLVKEKLEEKTPEERKAILLSWGMAENENDTTLAIKFLKEIIPDVNNTLEKEFEALLTGDERAGIADELIQIDKPVFDKPLKTLIESITSLAVTEGTNEKYEVLYFYENEADIKLEDIHQNAVVLLNEGNNKTVRFVKVVENGAANAAERELLPQTAYLTLSSEAATLFTGTKGKLNKLSKRELPQDLLKKQEGDTEERKAEIDKQNEEIRQKNQAINAKNAALMQKVTQTVTQVIENSLSLGGLARYKAEAFNTIKEKAKQAVKDYDGDNGDVLLPVLRLEYEALTKLDELEKTIDGLKFRDVPFLKQTHNHLKALVQKSYQQGIKGSFDEAYKALHTEYEAFKKLHRLRRTIDKLQVEDIPLLKEAHNRLKVLVQESYQQGIKGSFKEAYEPLNVEYQPFSALCEFIKEINQSALIDPNNVERKKCINGMLDKLQYALKQSNCATNSLLTKFKKEFDAFKQFDACAQKAFLIRGNYPDSTTKRRRAIRSIEDSANEQYRLYAEANKSANECKDNLIHQIKDIRDKVYWDHKLQSWTRILGYWQPKSRLVLAIVNQFPLEKNEKFQLPAVFSNMIAEKQSSRDLYDFTTFMSISVILAGVSLILFQPQLALLAFLFMGISCALGAVGIYGALNNYSSKLSSEIHDGENTWELNETGTRVECTKFTQSPLGAPTSKNQIEKPNDVNHQANGDATAPIALKLIS